MQFDSNNQTGASSHILEMFFVATGTAAYSLVLSCLVQTWETILCHHQAHILQDESTAQVFISGGAQLIPISGKAVKLKLAPLERYINPLAADPPYTPRVGALSTSQANHARARLGNWGYSNPLQQQSSGNIISINTRGYDAGNHLISFCLRSLSF